MNRNIYKETEDFRQAMIEKLNENSHKKHWNEAAMGWLFSRLEDEIKELKFDIIRILKNNTGGLVISSQLEMAMRECADVANMAMMIHSNLNKGILDGSSDTEYLEPGKE